MKPDYLICADDVFSVLTYLLWKVRKNVYGACIYIETILCCEYEEFSNEVLSNELESFHPDARHAFETIKSVSMIKQLPEEESSFLWFAIVLKVKFNYSIITQSYTFWTKIIILGVVGWIMLLEDSQIAF